MKLIDLTHVMENDMPVFPGTAAPIFSIAYSVEQNGFKETLMNMLTHTGTHLDCSSHFIKDAGSTDTTAIENFAGHAWICDLPIAEEIKENEDMTTYLNLPPNYRPDYILFRTMHSQYWKSPEYFHFFETPSNTLINRLIQWGIKGVGIDAISIDPMDSTNYPNHYSLLGNGKIIVENLKHLEMLKDKKFRFFAFPLKVKDGDGSPVRAVAEIVE